MHYSQWNISSEFFIGISWTFLGNIPKHNLLGEMSDFLAIHFFERYHFKQMLLGQRERNSRKISAVRLFFHSRIKTLRSIHLKRHNLNKKSSHKKKIIAISRNEKHPIYQAQNRAWIVASRIPAEVSTSRRVSGYQWVLSTIPIATFVLKSGDQVADVTCPTQAPSEKSGQTEVQVSMSPAIEIGRIILFGPCLACADNALRPKYI